MAKSLVQFRLDDVTKLQAISICERLGIDLPTAMRMFVSRMVQENGIPFSMKLEDRVTTDAIDALKAASQIAVENGVADMTLDEINEEIRLARK